MSMDTEHKADARDVLDLGAAPSMTEDKPAEAGATVSVPEVEADAKQELDIPQEEIERITRDVIEALRIGDRLPEHVISARPPSDSTPLQAIA